LTLDRVEAAGSSGVEDSLLAIGAVARLSGLPVSALRFYDGAGVLVPASVDPRTGYRWYAPDQVGAARLVARLRRVGMPLDSVRALLAGADPGPVLDAHLAQLEDGLAAARRELSAVRTLLDRSEPAVYLTVPAAALDAVRYAVGTDPSYAALHGVLLDADGDIVHAVASDRYRLAVASAPAAGASGRAFLPVAVVDELRGRGGTVTVTTADGELVATAGDRTVRIPAVPDGFPDWRRLEPAPASRRVALDGPAFRSALSGGPVLRKDRDGIPYDAVVLTLGPDGELTVGGDRDGLQVGVNRDFLLDALGDHAQLTLELDDPVTPLAIRVPGGADWSLLMPVRLDESPAATAG
jgi:DNA-binding transcriptional MerR regulator